MPHNPPATASDPARCVPNACRSIPSQQWWCRSGHICGRSVKPPSWRTSAHAHAPERPVLCTPTEERRVFPRRAERRFAHVPPGALCADPAEGTVPAKSLDRRVLARDDGLNAVAVGEGQAYGVRGSPTGFC
jgi:hypothetical protein